MVEGAAKAGAAPSICAVNTISDAHVLCPPPLFLPHSLIRLNAGMVLGGTTCNERCPIRAQTLDRFTPSHQMIST